MDGIDITGSEFVLALSSLKGWGATKVADYVIRRCYELSECLNFLEFELSKEEIALFKANISFAKKELADNAAKHIKSICLFDENFPKKLCECKDPVIHLYYVGDIKLLSSKCITVIGTRNPSEPFISNGYVAAKYFAEKGLTVVSGLAIGCDAIAHKATVDANGKTIAILPSSLDKIVPYQNRELARTIVKKGGLVISEYSVNSPMNKFNYPQRDRIQSILSNVTLVIQSEDNGGTMISVRKSLKENKKVYALEGNKLTLINNYISSESNANLDKIVEQA